MALSRNVLSATGGVLAAATASLVLGNATAPAKTNGDFFDSGWYLVSWLAVVGLAMLLAFRVRNGAGLLGAATVLPQIVYVAVTSRTAPAENDGLWVVGIALLVILGAFAGLLAFISALVGGARRGHETGITR